MKTNKTYTENLIIPMDLEALYLSADDAVREQFINEAVDFSKMPYRDSADGSFYNSGPNIGERLLRKPFESKGNLEQGIHLHWALPSILTHGEIHSEKEPSGQDGLVFPKAPNRWLICRSTKETKDNLKFWLVESDFLSSQRHGKEKVTVPVAESDNDGNPGLMPPYRYLGRVRTLDKNLKWENDGSGFNLTAVGYGDPGFAALYTNCPGVLGLHDPLLDTDISSIKGYTVIGWYEKAKSEKPIDGYFDLKKCRIALEEELSPEEKASKDISKIDLSDQLYHGAILFDHSQENSSENLNPKDVKVGIGNTASEALSAITSQSLGDDQAEYERALNLLRSDLVDTLNEQDGEALANDLLHQEGFISLKGGVQWEIAFKESAKVEDVHAIMEIENEISANLNELNSRQKKYNHLIREIEQRRAQLFGDWYKYLLLRYLPAYAPDDIDLNEVASFIHRQLGHISIGVAERTELCSKIKKLKDKIIQSSKNAIWELRETEAPRFWQAQDPVVAVQIDNKTDEFATGETLSLQARTPQSLSKSDKPDILKELLGIFPQERLSAFLGLIQELSSTDPANISEIQQHSYKLWTSNTFIPTLLDWKIRYHAIPKSKGHTNPLEEYSAGFFLENYELQNEIEDVIIRGERLDTFAEYYSGSVILTPSAGKQNKEAISKHIGSEKDNIPAPFILSQALNGFHEALLMNKQILQIQVWDTMASNDLSDHFSNEMIRAAIGDFNDVSPMPYSYYSPLRTGALSIAGIRLIDRFGRVKDMDPKDVQWSQGILAREKLKWTAENFGSASSNSIPKAAIRPRITQPSRLLFRWLYPEQNKSDEILPLQTSPAFGWIIPNFLERSMQIFDPEGQYLATIRSNEDGSKLLSITDDTSNTFPENYPGLSKWIGALVNTKDQSGNPTYNRKYLQDFLALINQSLQNINPGIRDQYQQMASLIGRPLALTRAFFSLELYSFPAPDQSWEAFKKDIKENPVERTHARFSNVKFPIRLGEVAEQNDGLVGYFVEEGSEPQYDTFYSQSAETRKGFCRAEPEHLKLSVKESFTLTMLVDPMAKVHATTGILPTKAIDIPAQFFTNALDNMAVRFLVNPLLVVPEAQTLANKTPDDNNQEGFHTIPEHQAFYLPLPGHQGIADQWNWKGPEKHIAGIEEERTVLKANDSFPFEPTLPTNIEFEEGTLQLKMTKQKNKKI